MSKYCQRQGRLKLSEEQVRAGLEELAGRPLDTSSKKATTRRRIIHAATQLLLERPLRRVRMEDIAERAGVSRGTLYTYADSKQDLVVMALAEEQLQHRDPLPDPGLAPPAQLKTIIANSILGFERMRLLALLVKGDVDLLRSLDRRPDVQRAFGGVSNHELIESAVDRTLEGSEPERVRVISSVVSAIASVGPHLMEAAAAVGLSAEELATTLSTVLVDGIDARLS